MPPGAALELCPELRLLELRQPGQGPHVPRALSRRRGRAPLLPSPSPYQRRSGLPTLLTPLPLPALPCPSPIAAQLPPASRPHQPVPAGLHQPHALPHRGRQPPHKLLQGASRSSPARPPHLIMHVGTQKALALHSGGSALRAITARPAAIAAPPSRSAAAPSLRPPNPTSQPQNPAPKPSKPPKITPQEGDYYDNFLYPFNPVGVHSSSIIARLYILRARVGREDWDVRNRATVTRRSGALYGSLTRANESVDFRRRLHALRWPAGPLEFALPAAPKSRTSGAPAVRVGRRAEVARMNWNAIRCCANCNAVSAHVRSCAPALCSQAPNPGSFQLRFQPGPYSGYTVMHVRERPFA